MAHLWCAYAFPWRCPSSALSGNIYSTADINVKLWCKCFSCVWVVASTCFSGFNNSYF